MKVLQINATYGIGSTGKIVQSIDIHARCHDIQSYVAYGRTSVQGLSNGYRIGNWLSWKLHALFSRLRGRQAYFSYWATWNLIQYIKRLKPDVVHVHNLHNNYVHLNMLLSFLGSHNVKTVITMHDCWLFTGGCFHYASIGCEKWKTGCHDCSKHDTFSLIGDSSARIWADRNKYLQTIGELTIVGCSKWIIDEVRQSFLKDKDCRVIYNGFDFDVYKPTESDLRNRLGLEGKKVILGPAAKWLSAVNRETLDYFVGHLASDQVLLLFGLADCGIELPENVRLYGFVNDQIHMAVLYSMADVLVNCSREDTLSSINIECQACGTPVVTYEATGSKETVDGTLSKAVQTGDYKALWSTTLSMLDNLPDGKACRSWTMATFEAESNYQKYLDLYQELLNK